MPGRADHSPPYDALPAIRRHERRCVSNMCSPPASVVSDSPPLGSPRLAPAERRLVGSNRHWSGGRAPLADQSSPRWASRAEAVPRQGAARRLCEWHPDAIKARSFRHLARDGIKTRARSAGRTSRCCCSFFVLPWAHSLSKNRHAGRSPSGIRCGSKRPLQTFLSLPWHGSCSTIELRGEADREDLGYLTL